MRGGSSHGLRRLKSSILATLVMLLLGCGAGGEAPCDGTKVGPNGGTIPFPDGGKVEIPPGALDKSICFTVQEIEPPTLVDEYAVVGKFHNLSPMPVEIHKHAIVTVPYINDGTVKDLDLPTMMLAWQGLVLNWGESPATVDEAAGTITAEVAVLTGGGPKVRYSTRPVCCRVKKAGVGHTALAMTAGECRQKGGDLEENEELCEVVCCDTAGAASEKPLLLCFDGGGKVLSGAFAAACQPSCCTGGGGNPWWTIAPGDQCSFYGSGTTPLVVDQDFSRCKDVCCAIDNGVLPRFYAPAPWAECNAFGNESLPVDQCDTVCCVAGKDGPKIIPTVMPAGRCAEVKGEAVFDLAQCDSVCCHAEAGGAPVTVQVTRRECESSGAEVVEWSQCEEVCCALGPNDSKAHLKVARADCAAYGGSEASLFAADCEPVCCRTEGLGIPGGALASKVACDAAGLPAEDLSRCWPFLCHTVTVADDSVVGVTLPPFLGDGLPGMATEDSSLCKDVCCDPASAELPGPLTVTKIQCQFLQGVEKPDSDCKTPCAGDCEPVCCTLSVAGKALSVPQPAVLCDHLGGTVASDPSACNLVAACMVELGSKKTFATTWQPDCETGGGVMPQPGDTATVCCDVGPHVLDSAVLCADIGGQGGLEEDCSDVCCQATSFPAPTMLPQVECATAGGQKVDGAECGRTCCIPEAGNPLAPLPLAMTEGACSSSSGTSGGDWTGCGPSCCRTYGLNLQMTFDLPAISCVPPQAESVSASECLSVCCRIGDEKNGDARNMPASQCIARGGVELDDPALCAPVCCDIGMGKFMMPRLKCDILGEEAYLTDCAPR